MLINSDDIKTTKEKIEVMQAFIDGKEIEYKEKFENNEYEKTYCPTWDFANYQYRIKQSEPEYVYPIYKRVKSTPETVVKFTSLDAGIYVSTHDKSIYKPGNPALNMAPHTNSSWEDYNFIEEKEERETSTIISKPTTIELFEVIYYCDILKEFEFVKQLYLDEDLINKRHLYKTGRSFIIDEDTRQLIKVVNQ